VGRKKEGENEWSGGMSPIFIINLK